MRVPNLYPPLSHIYLLYRIHTQFCLQNLVNLGLKGSSQNKIYISIRFTYTTLPGSLSFFAEHCYTLSVLLAHAVIINWPGDETEGLEMEGLYREGLERDRMEKEGVKGLRDYSCYIYIDSHCQLQLHCWTLREDEILSCYFSQTEIFRGFSLKRGTAMEEGGGMCSDTVLRVNEHKIDERPQRTGA